MSFFSPPILGKSREMFALPFFKITFIASFAILLCTIAFPVWRVVPDILGRTVVPMHYNIHFGVDRTGPWWSIFQLPAIGLGFFLINLFVAAKLWRHESMLSYLFAGVTVALEAILFVAMLFVVSLILSYG